MVRRRSDSSTGHSDPADAEIVAFLTALGEHDIATCDHARAVGAWCRRIATALAASAGEVAFVEACGVLHDVGKLQTPHAILTKPGPLTPGEWTQMKAHAAAGAALLEERPALARYAAAVRAHHERWDGTGYPDGLAGEAIPLAARIVAVADAFHAMISERPYRRALGVAEAFAELRRCSGSQFDPRAVDVLCAIADVTRGRTRLRRTSDLTS